MDETTEQRLRTLEHLYAEQIAIVLALLTYVIQTPGFDLDRFHAVYDPLLKKIGLPPREPGATTDEMLSALLRKAGGSIH